MALQAKTVVVPIDFSAESPRAVRTALEIAPAASDVHLVHVILPAENVSPGILWGDATMEKRERLVRESFTKFLADEGLTGPRVEVLHGDPGLQIADYAARVGADLVVIPSHGYHGVKRLVLGSVAERVIRHANFSVLVLRRSDAD